MKNKAQKLRVYSWPDLSTFRESLQAPAGAVFQADYVHQYLTELGAKSIVEEPNYFDRDYLDEFSAFYGVGAKGYPNHCRRLHFFSDDISRDNLRRAVGGSDSLVRKLQDSYLGFCVIRPIPSAPLGRTVLRWYEDKRIGSTPRVVAPSRDYFVHISGLRLKVFGLAWQQQDQGVSACATIGLWSVFHSSAFNERHGIPTTAEITRAAHKNISFGSRVFPSRSLQLEQVCEAVKELGLSPFLVSGDLAPNNQRFFSKTRFCNTLSSLNRSKLPCLVIGDVVRPNGRERGGHVCVYVGFRSKLQPSGLTPDIYFEDADLDFVYIHDDNIGPAIKFQLETFKLNQNDPNSAEAVRMKPARLGSNAANDSYGHFYPRMVLVAVENDLRTSSDALIVKGIDVGSQFYSVAAQDALDNARPAPIMSMGMRFFRLDEFFDQELESRVGTRSAISRVRLRLQEDVPPMSLYLGVIRVGDANGPLIDVLYDTTDSDINHPVFATIAYDKNAYVYVANINSVSNNKLGVLIKGY